VLVCHLAHAADEFSRERQTGRRRRQWRRVRRGSVRFRVDIHRVVLPVLKVGSHRLGHGARVSVLNVFLDRDGREDGQEDRGEDLEGTAGESARARGRGADGTGTHLATKSERRRVHAKENGAFHDVTEPSATERCTQSARATIGGDRSTTNGVAVSISSIRTGGVRWPTI
jgi:hypothetical protein